MDSTDKQFEAQKEVIKDYLKLDRIPFIIKYSEHIISINSDDCKEALK